MLSTSVRVIVSKKVRTNGFQRPFDAKQVLAWIEMALTVALGLALYSQISEVALLSSVVSVHLGLSLGVIFTGFICT